MPFRSQPAKPLKPSEIVQRRPIHAPKPPVHAFPSTNGMQLTTVAPPPKPVLTIVSWNIQKFEENKSQANPYVNVVISKVLEELDADVCLLLEAREHNATNLAAIEHRLANPANHVSDQTTEAEWNLQELEKEYADVLANSSVVAAQGGTYEMLSTDLTGKRYKPPRRIYLYDNPESSYVFPAMGKGLSITTGPRKKKTYNGQWKEFYRHSKVFRDYYEAYSIRRKQPIDPDTVALNQKAEHDVVFRLRSCETCGHRLGDRIDCPGCHDFNPYSGAADNLRNEIKTCAFSLGGVDLESYAILVRPHGSPSVDGTTQLKGKAATVNRYGCTLLRHLPASSNPYTPAERRNAYLFGKGMTGAEPDQAQWNRISEDLKLRGESPGPFGRAALLDVLNIPRTAAQPPLPLDENARYSLYASHVAPVHPMEALLRHAMASNADPGMLNLTQLLDVAGVPSNTAQPDRELSLEERGAIFEKRHPSASIEQAVANSGRAPLDVLSEAALDRLGFPKKPTTGGILPYLDPNASTYGRSPFVLPLAAQLGNDTAMTTFPVVAFHAPYGKDNAEGLQVRVDALTQVLHADPGNGTCIGAHGNAIIMGDFNLDLLERQGNRKGAAAKEAYRRLAQAGFEAAIPEVASSLKGVYNQKKKTKNDGPYKKFENVEYQKLSASADITRLTSSAYDNIMVRGAALQSRVVTAAVVDVVGWIKDQIDTGRMDTVGAAAVWPGFNKLATTLQKAFFIYHVFVSDHLPVLLDIEVEALKPDFDQTQQALLTYRKVMAERTKVRVSHVGYSDAWLTPCPPAESASFVRDVADLHIGQLVHIEEGGIVVRTAQGDIKLASPGRKIQSAIQPGALVAAVYAKDEKPYVHLLADLAAPVDCAVLVDRASTSLFVIGKVVKRSTNGKRIRIQFDRFLCILPVPDEWDGPPAVGSYVAALLRNARESQVELAM